MGKHELHDIRQHLGKLSEVGEICRKIGQNVAEIRLGKCWPNCGKGGQICFSFCGKIVLVRTLRNIQCDLFDFGAMQKFVNLVDLES